MLICAILPSEVEAARRLLAANGWAQRVADAEQFRLLIARSQRALVAIDDAKSSVARAPFAMEYRTAT